AAGLDLDALLELTRGHELDPRGLQALLRGLDLGHNLADGIALRRRRRGLVRLLGPHWGDRGEDHAAGADRGTVRAHRSDPNRTRVRPHPAAPESPGLPLLTLNAR